MSSPIKISVITASWNCIDTINECLDSVGAQSWGNTEHVVIDGASKDGTVDLLKSRRNDISVLVSEQDNGIYDALNKGVEHASGEVVGFLHADDIYADENVLADVAAAFDDSTIQAVYGDLQYVQKQDTNRVVRFWRSAPFTPCRLAAGWMPAHPTLYVRREWYQRIGGFDTRYRIAADYFSILQMFSQPDFRSVYLPRVMVKMRLGGESNRSLKNIIRKSREDLDALRRSGVGGTGALLWKNLSKVTQFLGNR